MTAVLDYLDDILDRVEKIKQYTRGMTYDEFVDDPKTVDAVLRNFEMIGEQRRTSPMISVTSMKMYRGQKWLACAVN